VTLPPNAGTPRLPLVDYLRGLASLAVAWFHLTNTYPQASLVRQSGSYLWAGVEVFFVISGFIIPWSMGAATSAGFSQFLSRRLLRIELPYVVSIIAVIVLDYASSLAPAFRGPQPRVDPYNILLNVFYLVPILKGRWIQPVYWTLAYEFVFYVFIALAFVPIVSNPKRWPFLALALGLGVLAAAGAISAYFLLFVLGCAAYRRAVGRSDVAEWAATMGVAVAVMALRNAWLESVVGGVTALILTSCASTRLSGRAGAILTWFGTISYSLYLAHVPLADRVVNLGKRFVSGEAADLLLSLTALALCLVGAWLFHRLVEAPAQRLARSLKRGDGKVGFARAAA